MPARQELILYHMVPSRSSIVHWMLEEIGVPHELRLLDPEKGETRTPAFLALNPMGKVPVLVHDGVAIGEAAAICCHLADAFADAGLAPQIGDPARGPYLRWLFFAPSCMEPAATDRWLGRDPGPRSAVGYGDYDTVFATLEQALRPGPFLLGERFSAADVVVGSGLRWGRITQTAPDRGVFRDYVARLTERPAFQRAAAEDQKIMAARGG